MKLLAGTPSGYALCRSVSSSACHRPTRTMSPPVYATATSTRQVTLPPPYPFRHSPSQRVVEVAALDQWLAMLYPRVEHQTVLAVVVVVVGPLVVHPYHPFRMRSVFSASLPYSSWR